MKLKNISCTQFAGVRDQNVSFTEGLNVVCGNNETGKSTLVNLISRTLFQNAKLDRRKDKDFFELYFPGARKGSSLTGDFADGKISIETEKGIYILSKEWGVDPRCTLSTPDGVIRDPNSIRECLKEELHYGEGVYSELLFSSQRNTDLSLQTILDAEKKSDAKQEITRAVSQAFSESGGISTDAIEQAIQEKIDEIAGKHWDFEQEAPMRKAGRWSAGMGEILKAYYAMEDAKNVLAEISYMEEEADRALGEYLRKDEETKKAETAYQEFQMFASRIAVQRERKKAAERIEQELTKISEVLRLWPEYEKRLENAQKLKNEMTDCELLEKYQAAKGIIDEINLLQEGMEGLTCPSDLEIQQVKTAGRRIEMLENRFCGMNLYAAVQMYGEHEVEITSLRTGERVDLKNGGAAIAEAVQVTIPGVLAMQLSPADVDIEKIEAEIAEETAFLQQIFEKYHVQTSMELEDLAKRIREAKTGVDNGMARLEMLLGDIDFKDLENATARIKTPVRPMQNVQEEIFELCGRMELGTFLAKTEAMLENYVAEYESMFKLKEKSLSLETERRNAESANAETLEIPSEFLEVSDPETYLEKLKNDLKHKQELRENALTEKTAAVSRLENIRERISEDPLEAAETAEQNFNETCSLLRHWMHIAEVFRMEKEKLQEHPLEDLADYFAKYLSMISDGNLSMEFPEPHKLDLKIYSENKLLDYEKLSEGTKETVSLAFRLAVLDHLFPEGGGIIVFDDPLTDMDEQRMRCSCSLIRECAKRHQVIFLTCREEYARLLQGNVIKL